MNKPNLSKLTLSICLVTWNSEKFLPGLFESIFKQTILTKEDYNVAVSINMVDSGSFDQSVAYTQKNYPEIHVLRNTQNLGFAKSYNQAIKMSSTDYVFVVNADVVLEEDYLEKLLNVIQIDNKIGAVAGKILRAQFLDGLNTGLPDIEKTNIFDSCGLKAFRNRRIINIAEGEVDSGQYDNLREVFGFSACAVLYRRQALDDVAVTQEYFDEDFFAYKEDVDLSYRLLLAGYKNILVTEAVAYHFRSVKKIEKKYSNWQVAKSYRQKRRLIRFFSYKNHLLCLVKNETTRNFLKDFFYIVWYELRKFIYLCFFDIQNLKALYYTIKLLPKMMRKRKAFLSQYAENGEILRKWLVKKYIGI